MGRRNNRKRPFGEIIKNEYSSTTFTKKQSSGRPRSPHRFFSSSYTVKKGSTQQTTTTTTTISNTTIQQVVHKHVNGLCIVTAGEIIPSSVRSIQFVVNEAPASSAAEKRKRQAKMLKGSKIEDTVSPTTKIAELNLEDGTVIPLLACVFGTILELNKSLTPEILKDDPLLNGFLAVILPSGDYPPNIDETMTEESKEYIHHQQKQQQHHHQEEPVEKPKVDDSSSSQLVPSE